MKAKFMAAWRAAVFIPALLIFSLVLFPTTGQSGVRAQGADNRFLDFETAIYYAVAGDNEKALGLLEAAAQKSVFAILPLGEWVPEFATIKSELRFATIENKMLQLVNGQRAELGLDPVNPSEDFW